MTWWKSYIEPKIHSEYIKIAEFHKRLLSLHSLFYLSTIGCRIDPCHWFTELKRIRHVLYSSAKDIFCNFTLFINKIDFDVCQSVSYGLYMMKPNAPTQHGNHARFFHCVEKVLSVFLPQMFNLHNQFNLKSVETQLRLIELLLIEEEMVQLS